MRIDLEFESKSPFLPPFNIPLNISKFNNFEQLRVLVLEKEQEILNTYKPYPENDSKDWLTNRLYAYNLFDYMEEYPVLIEFKKFIYDSYVEYCNSTDSPVENVYANCWANIIRNDSRTISPHTHTDAHIGAPLEYSYVSGNICITAIDTKTYYANPFIHKTSYGISNTPGELVLFPSWVLHWVDENKSETPRISIAFDIVTEHVYNLPSDHKNNFRKL
jgi:hypothetical protein